MKEKIFQKIKEFVLINGFDPDIVLISYDDWERFVVELDSYQQLNLLCCKIIKSPVIDQGEIEVVATSKQIQGHMSMIRSFRSDKKDPVGVVICHVTTNDDLHQINLEYKRS